MKKVILFLLCTFGLFCLMPVQAASSQIPVAERGVLDLTDWGFTEQGIINLNGDWEFYWQEFWQPSQIPTRKSIPSYLEVPSTWRGKYLMGEVLPSGGYATYRLTINFASHDSSLKALKIPTIYTAYKLYANNELVTSRGTIGTSASEVKPNAAPQTIFVTPVDGKLDLVIQVANFHHSKGGIRNSIILGTPDQILHMNNNFLFTRAILLGSLLIIGLYYLVYFIFRQEEKFAIYFALFCLALCTYQLLSREAPLYLIFPNLNWALAKRIEYVSFYSCLPLYICFIKELYPTKFLRNILDILLIIVLMVWSLALLAPTSVYMQSLPFFTGLIIFFLLCYLCILIQATCGKGDNAFLPITTGFLALFSVVNDILNYYSVINTYYGLSSIGILVYLFSQAIVLSKRQSQAMTKAEELSAENAQMLDEITNLNRNLEDRISQRTAQLNEIIEVLNNEILERTETEQKLKLYATTDIMTGLANRVTCIDTLKTQLAMAQINNSHLTVCFIDIDNLKVINDEFGHPVGDDLIINISDILKSRIRQTDTIGRIGGDEFLIVFPQCTQQEAELLWQRVEEAIQEFNQTTNKPYRISLSHGFAEYRPGDDITAQTLIEKADSKMYQVKRPEPNQS